MDAVSVVCWAGNLDACLADQKVVLLALEKAGCLVV